MHSYYALFEFLIQIAETNRMSVLNIPKAVCMRRYGVLRLLADYRLILHSALYYGKQCDLIKDEKAFVDAVDVSNFKIIIANI